MKQTRIVSLTMLFLAASVVSFFPVSVEAFQSNPGTQQVETLETPAPVNVEQAQEKVRANTEQARNAANHTRGDLTRNDEARENRGQNNANKAQNEEDRQLRLDANQTRKCEKKQEMISDKLDKISNRGSKQLEVFQTISTRVQAFYVEKEYSAPGYEELVSELDALYDQSLVALTSTQNANDGWGCLTHSPIASLDTFKEAKRSEMATLATYKEKVRELILLVKQAGGTN